MPNRWHNWRFEDVEVFLRLHGFEMHRPTLSLGSHFTWTHPELPDAVVELQYHAGEAINPTTLRSCARQSRIPDDEWLAYSRDKNKYVKQARGRN